MEISAVREKIKMVGETVVSMREDLPDGNDAEIAKKEERFAEIAAEGKTLKLDIEKLSKMDNKCPILGIDCSELETANNKTIKKIEKMQAQAHLLREEYSSVKSN